MFKDKLKETRLSKGHTQATLALVADMKPCHVSHFETGRREPNMATLRKLKAALGCEWEELLD